MMMRTLFLCSALTIGWGVVVLAQTTDVLSPQIDFFEAGVLCAQDDGITRDAPDTVAGTTHIVEQAPPFVSTGRLVPAVIGIGFGVRASVQSIDGLDAVTMTVTHPPFADSGATQQSFITGLGAAGMPGITFYQFDYGYELAVGDWTMTATAGTETLYEVTFTVVAPTALPDLAGACGYLDLLS